MGSALQISPGLLAYNLRGSNRMGHLFCSMAHEVHSAVCHHVWTIAAKLAAALVPVFNATEHGCSGQDDVS